LKARARRIGGLVVLVAAVVGLSGAAWHGEHTEGQLTATHFTRSADRSNAYYGCLSAQVHSLIHSGDVVYLSHPTLTSWVTLTKVIGGWAHETLQQDRSTMAVTLQEANWTGNCDGQVLISVRRDADGKIVMARGRNGTS
jgi:hypothetical protein